MFTIAGGVVILVSLVMIGMGLIGLVSPSRLPRLVSPFQSRAGLRAAGLLRVVFGVALWATAPASHTPLALQVLAVVSLASGFALPLIGLARFKKLIDWWLRRSPALIRGWCLAAAAFGVFLLWSVAN